MGAAWRAVAAVCGAVLLVLVVLYARGAEGDRVAEGVGAVPGYPALSRAAPSPDLAPRLRPDVPYVYGHRGSWAYRPEHTAAGYRLAIDSGVQYVESDVVSTKDGVLVVRHDNELSIASDVEDRPEFRDRYTTKEVEGVQATGWFAEDFTLAEIKTLRAEESQASLRPASAAFDGRYEILTLDEVLELVASESRRVGRKIGLLVEPQYPRHFRELGLPLEEKLAEQLVASGLTRAPARVVLESFNLGTLERLDSMVPDTVAFALLVNAENGARLTPAILAQAPPFLDAVLFHKGGFAGRDDLGGWVDEMHDAGLAVIVWPVSFENKVLTPAFRRGRESAVRGDLQGEVDALLEAGVDGLLADAPSDVVDAVAASPAR